MLAEKEWFTGVKMLVTGVRLYVSRERMGYCSKTAD